MRVLHVIPSLSPAHGGPTEAIIPMVAALHRGGIAAEIATTDDDLALARSATRHLVCAGITIRFFHCWRGPSRQFRRFGVSPAFVRWLWRKVQDYDVLHVHALFSFLPTTAMFIARRNGIPFISRPLGQLGHWPLRQSARRKKWYWTLFEERNLQNAAFLHYTSLVEQEEASPLGLHPSAVVIAHGVDVPEAIPGAGQRLRQELGWPMDAKIVLFLGRIHRKKGLDLLVRALAKITESPPKLLIAGEGEDRGELEQLIEALGLTARVLWLGHVTGKRKQLCLQGSDLFALTSHHENMGMAVLEALAAGTPVLVSEQVALAEEIRRENLGYVVPLEVPEIARGLHRAFTNPLKTDGENRRAFVHAQYSWQQNAQSLEELYSLAVAKSR